MNPEAELQRTVGRLEADVASLKAQVSDMQSKVDEMHRTLMQAAGGWKVLLAVGTGAGAIGAVLMKFLSTMGIVK